MGQALRRGILTVGLPSALFLWLAAGGCTEPVTKPYERVRPAKGRLAYLVVADQPLAAACGMEILEKGGNAADAAAAVSFALAVVRPEDCGLGGGGFALYAPPGQQPVVLDFREQAPAGLRREDFLDREGRPVGDRSRIGALAVGTPGQVLGAITMWRRFGSGTLGLPEILAPAIRLAEEGFPVDRHLHRAMVDLAERYRRRPEFKDLYAETYKEFLKPGGVPYRVGEILRRPALAGTLRSLSLGGAELFYRGEIGQQVVKEVRRLGGVLNVNDLAEYQVRVLEPLRADVHDYTVWSIPPPSSGGAVLLEVLKVLDRADREKISIWRPHLLVEAMKHAFADRAQFLGDRSDSVLAAVDRMLSESRAREILSEIDPQHAREVKIKQQSTSQGGTSHFCVVDARGGAVSWTESINLSFGSLVTVPGTGIVLNDTLDDFALSLSSVNAFGLRQGQENLLRPAARPLSSMTPVIVFGENGLRLVAGASGGPKIISSVLHVVVRVLWDGMSVGEAVRRPRWHHQWVPDVLFIEPEAPAEILREFLRRGHVLRAYSGAEAGCVQAVERRGTLLRGVADPRKNAL